MTDHTCTKKIGGDSIYFCGHQSRAGNRFDRVLQEFQNVMFEQFPKVLPSRRTVDHEIELLPRVKPPAKGPYCMAPPKLVELRKQLDELLQVGFFRPSKAPFGAPVLFQKKQDGSL